LLTTSRIFKKQLRRNGYRYHSLLVPLFWRWNSIHLNMNSKCWCCCKFRYSYWFGNRAVWIVISASVVFTTAVIMIQKGRNIYKPNFKTKEEEHVRNEK
jgi:hypothetical protein